MYLFYNIYDRFITLEIHKCLSSVTETSIHFNN